MMKKLLISPLWAIAILLVTSHFLNDVMQSIWPVFKTMRHLNLAQAGFLYGASVIVGELLQVVFGRFIDKGFQKEILILGLVLGAVPVLFPYADNFWLFFLLLVLSCAGSAAIHPTTASLLGGMGGRKAHFLGLFQMAGNFGTGFGQLIFTFFYQYLNIPILMALPAIILAILFSQSKTITTEHVHIGCEVHFREAFRFFRVRPLRLLYLVQLFSQTIMWSTVFLLPDLLQSKGYGNLISFGGGNFAFFAGAAIGCLPVGWLKARFMATTTIRALLGAALISFYLFCVAPLGPAFMMTLLFFFGLFIGAIMPLVLDLGGDFVPHRKGLVSAFLMGLVWIVSEGVGISLASFLASTFQTDGPTKSLLIFGTLFIPSLLLTEPLSRYEKEKFVL